MTDQDGFERGYYVGVDIGGTFTDVVVIDEDGGVLTVKAPTTPGRLADGVMDGLQLAAERLGSRLDEFLPQVRLLGHGTTQATNALIERKGARVALLTTEGFADTLFVQRLLGFTAGTPSDHLGWYSRRRYPEPIVPRAMVREVAERVDHAGSVVVELDEPGTRAAVAEMIEAGVEGVAVSLLWSFRNPEHERAVGRMVEEAGGGRTFVSLSSDVNPVIGEYERTATTVLNTYLGPVVAGYVDLLAEALADGGFTGAFYILNSSGGVMSAREARGSAVQLLVSGPTGGVIGSRYLAQELGHANVITTDMGGTSFDVGMIVEGTPVVRTMSEVAQYHVSVGMLDIAAVGAGGGSIAAVEGGLIRIGPESAGATPGPACYGRGGTRPTVTDADVVLGIIDPDAFLGGRMRLDRDAAEEAIRRHIAEPLGLDVVEAAAGIKRIVDAKMADTLREVTIGRGHDPRDFVLYAYGGAGPMHCAGYGAESGVRRIVVPATSMVHSAYGALASDVQHTAQRSILVGAGGESPWEALDGPAIERDLHELEERCLAALEESGVPRASVEISRSADMRYRRQTHDLIVALEDGPVDGDSLRTLIEGFERTYEARYGRGSAFREAGIELTTLRVTAVGRTARPRLGETIAGDVQASGNGHRPVRASRPVYDVAAGRHLDTAVVPWQEIGEGERLEGPLIVEHPETTVLVPRGFTASTDPYGNLFLDATEAS